MARLSSKLGLYCGEVVEISQPLLPMGMKTPISMRLRSSGKGSHRKEMQNPDLFLPGPDCSKRHQPPNHIAQLCTTTTSRRSWRCLHSLHATRGMFLANSLSDRIFWSMRWQMTRSSSETNNKKF